MGVSRKCPSAPNLVWHFLRIAVLSAAGATDKLHGLEDIYIERERGYRALREGEERVCARERRNYGEREGEGGRWKEGGGVSERARG